MSGFPLPISAAPPTCIPTKNSKAPPKKNRRHAEFKPVLSESDLSASRSWSGRSPHLAKRFQCR